MSIKSRKLQIVLAAIVAIILLMVVLGKFQQKKAYTNAYKLQGVVQKYRDQKGYYPYYTNDLINFDQSARKYIGVSGSYHVTFWPRECDVYTQQCNSYEIQLYQSLIGSDINYKLTLKP